MPSLSTHHSSSVANGLLVGDNGSGKTGSLASLVKAGYYLHILDCDKGIDVLASLLKDDPAALDRVEYETVTDSFRKSGVHTVPQGDGWQKAVNTLDKWANDKTFDSSHIIAVDSLTFLGRLSMSNTMRIVNRTGQKPEQQHWGSAIEDLEWVLGQIHSLSHVNTLVLTHMVYIEEKPKANGDMQIVGTTMETSDSKAYPTALGSKLPTNVGRYFNTVLGYKITGAGIGTKRMISTTPVGTLGCKTPSPTTVKKEYPLETGLADYFRDIGIAPPKK